MCVATYQSLGPAWKASELGDDFSHGWQTGFLAAHAWCWALDHRFFQSIDVLARSMASFEVDRKHFKTAPSATEEAQPDGTTFRSVPEAENGLREIGPRTETGLLGPCPCYGMNHGAIWRGHR